MNKEVIGLIVGTIVIFLSFVFVCGTFLFLYLRDQKLVRLAKSSVQGTVIGYSRFREGYPPIVEYTVDGISYKKTLQYFMFKTVTIPWGTTKFLKDYTRAGPFDHSLQQLLCFLQTLDADPFPPSFGADSLV